MVAGLTGSRSPQPVGPANLCGPGISRNNKKQKQEQINSLRGTLTGTCREETSSLILHLFVPNPVFNEAESSKGCGKWGCEARVRFLTKLWTAYEVRRC